MRRSAATLVGLINIAFCTAYDQLLAFNSTPIVETRSIDEIYQAALKEGGVVTAWHGGDEPNQQDALKQAFEQRFPGITLNITVDLSKYHDGKIDQMLADGNVYVDSIILQTLHDYPRWKEEGALLHYAPLGFDKVAAGFKDIDAAYYGYRIFAWTIGWNSAKWNGTLSSFEDFLNPSLKDKLVVTYPNDDDAVLFAFDLIMSRLGTQWFDAFLTQNPRWVRGTATPTTILTSSNYSSAATFISGSFSPTFANNSTIHGSLPTDAPFVTWPQTAAILKDAPHPETAKLLHNFLLSRENQFPGPQFSVRTDLPAGYPDVLKWNGTDPQVFAKWMADRTRVERLRFFFEDRLGTAQGLSPLIDGI